jgi:hypothetical protein
LIEWDVRDTPKVMEYKIDEVTGEVTIKFSALDPESIGQYPIRILVIDDESTNKYEISLII